MDRSILQVMLAAGVLLLISVFASKTSTRYGLPVLLMFIIVGMLSGAEGPGGIHFENPQFAHILGTVSLIFILYSGGLSSQLNSVEPIWREGVTLAIVGVLLSTVIMSVIIHFSLGWTWATSALLSSIFSSTDASAVFGILKTQKLQLRSKIQALLELESGSNDPMAVFLTITLIQLVMSPHEISLTTMLMNFFIQMSLGGLAGWFMGKGLVQLINWLDLDFEGLYPVLTIAGVVCIYSITEFCGGNGFLSVYIAGLAMGSEKYFSKQTLNVFHDGLAWLMQVAMFLTLGLMVYPSELTPTMREGIFISLALLLIARPISVYLCLFKFRYSWREMVFISWGGLRGAVPIILATYLLFNRAPSSKVMFNIVFFIVVFSMLVQGTTLRFLTQKLKLEEPYVFARKLPFKSRTEHRDFVEFDITKSSPLLGKNILELDSPVPVLVVLIHRSGEDFIPKGNTDIELNDKLVCLIETKSINEFEQFILGKKDGSNGRS